MGQCSGTQSSLESDGDEGAGEHLCPGERQGCHLCCQHLCWAQCFAHTAYWDVTFTPSKPGFMSIFMKCWLWLWFLFLHLCMCPCELWVPARIRKWYTIHWIELRVVEGLLKWELGTKLRQKNHPQEHSAFEPPPQPPWLLRFQHTAQWLESRENRK